MNAVLKPRVAFRPMQKDDLDTIVAIEQVIFPYPWTRGNFMDSLNAGHSCWVMQQDETIVGYAIVMMVLDEAHLLNISVAQAMQGRGLGRLLLEHVMQIGRQYGGLNMFLVVRPSNTLRCAFTKAWALMKWPSAAITTRPSMAAKMPC